MVWANYNYIAITYYSRYRRSFRKDESVANPFPTIIYNVSDKHIIIIGSRIIA